MNEDDIERILREHYEGYCNANEESPDEDVFEAFFTMAEERIEEMSIGGYTSEQALEEYIDKEATGDVAYMIKRMR